MGKKDLIMILGNSIFYLLKGDYSCWDFFSGKVYLYRAQRFSVETVFQLLEGLKIDLVLAKHALPT